jgi:hypothetical protein
VELNEWRFGWMIGKFTIQQDHGKIGRVSGHTVGRSAIFAKYFIFRFLIFLLEQGCNVRSTIAGTGSGLSVDLGVMPQFAFRRAYLKVPPMDREI